jgi:LEA14-like dessication related protein
MRVILALCSVLSFALAGCATLSSGDPLNVSVAGLESLPGEGLELRLAVRIRVQNPNDTDIQYNGAALTVNVNGH